MRTSSHSQRRDPDRLYKEVIVGGIRTACVSREQMTRLMVGDCMAARKGKRRAKLIFASNGHAISMVRNDPDFRKNFIQADLIHADGQPVVMASKFLTNAPIPERSATTDFIHDAASKARETGLRFYMFGSTEETNAAAAKRMQEMYPGLNIVGRRHGYFSPDEEEEIVAEINATKPDIVWVALGVPKEYEFCVRNKGKIEAGWVITAGGCFNFVTGDYKRAPRWMQATSLEWLHRLWREPKRLWKRYAITNPIALFTILTRTLSYSMGQPAADRDSAAPKVQ